MVVKDFDFDFGLNVFVDKNKEVIELKNRHLGEVVEKFEEIKHECKNKINTSNQNQTLYLTGVVDGMDFIIGLLRKYNEGMKG